MLHHVWVRLLNMRLITLHYQYCVTHGIYGMTWYWWCIPTHMWNYVGGLLPLMSILWQEHAQHGPVETLPLCCAQTRMWFHAFSLCLLIGFVAHDLHNLVVVVCRLFVPHCDVDAYSTHAGRTSISVARSSSSHLWMKLTSLWRCINIFEMYACARIVIHLLSCALSHTISTVPIPCASQHCECSHI